MIDKTEAISALMSKIDTVGAKGSTAVSNSVQAEDGQFGDIIAKALDSANAAAEKSKMLGKQFQMDDPNVTLEETVIASNISSLQFTAILQVRNKLTQAYNDVMNMPI